LKDAKVPKVKEDSHESEKDLITLSDEESDDSGTGGIIDEKPDDMI
jgi:hypothetical protein